MRIGHGADRAMPNSKSSKLARHHHRRFDVYMSVNEAGKDVTVGLVNLLNGRDALFSNRNDCRVNAALMEIDYIGGQLRHHKLANLKLVVGFADSIKFVSKKKLFGKHWGTNPSRRTRHSDISGWLVAVNLEDPMIMADINDPEFVDTSAVKGGATAQIVTLDGTPADDFHGQVGCADQFDDSSVGWPRVTKSPGLNGIPCCKHGIWFASQLSFLVNEPSAVRIISAQVMLLNPAANYQIKQLFDLVVGVDFFHGHVHPDRSLEILDAAAIGEFVRQ